MSTSEEIHRLEAELEFHKEDLREDAARISDKIAETKARLSPANFVRHKPGLSLAAALILGIATDLIFRRRELRAEEIIEPGVNHIAKPLARALLTGARRDAATQAVRGS